MPKIITVGAIHVIIVSFDVIFLILQEKSFL